MRLPGMRRNEEGGFILAIVAASTTILVLSAAFVVDVGGWYSRGLALQRAADAAALAGVVWMPDFPVARTVALEAAARNGIVPGGEISLTVEPDPSSSRRLVVTVTDGEAPQAFSGMFRSSQSITRRATGEYILPVPLGSPKNTFGTGDLLSGANRENFWAAVNGYCAGHESGDLKLARYESYSGATSGPNCNNGSALSPDYDPAGYLYAIELPQNKTSLKLEVYDAGYNTSLSTPDTAVTSEAQTVTTTFQVYGADNTPLDTSDNPLLNTVTVGTNNLLYKNLWMPLRTWVNPTAGTYYLRIKTSAAQTAESRASNGFGLRAYTGLLFSACTTIPGDTGYSTGCPQIHGVGAMSIYANLGGTSGSTATFYLADVNPIHAGKTMQITLFDAGEGAQKIEVLDPAGVPARFGWSTRCNPPSPPSGGCSGSNVTSLSVSGTGAQPYSGLQSTSKYNDRKMILDIKLPADYTARYGSDSWWQIRYTVGSTPTDRTTWSVAIVGDPVHLVGG